MNIREQTELASCTMARERRESTDCWAPAYKKLHRCYMGGRTESSLQIYVAANSLKAGLIGSNLIS